MPEERETITIDELASALNSSVKLIIFDCRNNQLYQQCHIRTSINFSIPGIVLRRLANGKIELFSTINIKCTELKNRIQDAFDGGIFVLYNDDQFDTDRNSSLTNESSTINVLHRKLKQNGCHKVMILQDGFTKFHESFPDWCIDEIKLAEPMTTSTGPSTEHLMGLRALRISTPHSDSTCSSSAESSDCEGSQHPTQMSNEPIEIIQGLYLGTAQHSEDSRALEKYNIQYILNVTTDLPNVFEKSSKIQYLKIPIKDQWNEDLVQYFPDAINFIKTARSKGASVLVHCLAGISRSVTVTLAYLMYEQQICLEDAFSLVRAKKSDISPNMYFMQELQTFEKNLNLDSGNKSAVSYDSPAYLISDSDDKLDSNSFKDNKSKGTPFGIGVSPDSGIEFDRWTPADGTPK